jgi:hypothetical protein
MYPARAITMKRNATYSSFLASICLLFCLSTQPALAFVSVTVQPPSQVVLVGSNAVFIAQATPTANETITGYTWLMSTNGLSPFNPIPGATTAICTLTNVQTSDGGSYYAKVTYNSGTTNGLTSASPAVTLTVHDQARITAQPQGGFIRTAGTSASFSVSALGLAPLAYQWRLNGKNLVDNGRITGATNANLSLTNLVTTDSGSYDVVVTNLYASATSQVATLDVYIPVGISVPPQNIAVIVGSNAVFSVTASGSEPLSYQWRRGGANLVNGGRISGATSNVLTIAAVTTNDAGSYTVFFTNPVSTITSAVATLTVLVPAKFTSPTNAIGRQGAFFSFTNTATGTKPITFGADGLPAGLSLEPTNGVISGIPAVMGVFNVAVYATNAALTTTGKLTITLTTGVPGITSKLSAGGKQGQNFTYTITASNNPASFSCSVLPDGLNLNPTTGVISGPPIVSGTFPLTIGAANQYGSDSRQLTLTITSSVPVITSALTATGTENLSGFSYTIQASDFPTVYGASGLPLGLTLDTTTGAITGTPLYGGTFTVPIWAINPWGTGSTNLTLNIAYATVGGLAIIDVANVWSKPYLLDFSFSLRDGTDPATDSPVVRPPSQLQVTCMEDGVPIDENETAVILQSGDKKQLRSSLVLDYTYSMFKVPGAIDAMQSAAELLINEEPVRALFSIWEFHAEYVNPLMVTTNPATTNGFLANKVALSAAIDGIQSNYVKGNYAGTRCWDAMYAALKNFGPTNADERRYLIAMTDGNDDSSLLNTNKDPVGALVTLAKANQVKIFCVAFGDNVNTNALQRLTSQTAGHYYLAATTDDLATQFQKIVKDVNGQYLLRWATLRRAPKVFQPSFQVTVDGITASFNSDLIYQTNESYKTNITVDPIPTPPVTNIDIVTNITVTNIVMLPYNPTNYAGDVRIGSLRLVPDADVGPKTIRLRATYAPRYVREIRLNYRPNYPCTPSLDATGTNELLYGWSLAETTDTNGLRTLTMTSPNPADLLTSIDYGAFGDLLSFNFTYPESLTATQAFSIFSVDNSVYTNMLPSGQSFVMQNATNFITLYPLTPPHGTPIPWLIAYGFTTDFAAAELIATNGLPVWQAYVAGLNPTNANSHFTVSTAFAPGQVPQIIFSTVATRTYRVETATSLGVWEVLFDNIPGTGGDILFMDNRVLSGVNAVFYRVAVY